MYYLAGVETSLRHLIRELRKSNISYEMARFTSLTKGTIYELKPFNVSAYIESFSKSDVFVYNRP